MRDLAGLLALAERGRGHGRPVLPGADIAPRLTVRAAAGGRTAVLVYGYIGDDWDGVSAATFARELAGIGDGGIDLHINSGGGSVFDGIAMHAALRNHSSDVTSYVDGVAASAASFLAMAGDEIVIEKPAKMMIHNASGIVYGHKADMLEMAALLDELDGTIAAMYADRAGGPVADWSARMDATTWYGSAEAVAVGLADRVANAPAAAPEDRRSQLIRARARVALRGASAHH